VKFLRYDSSANDEVSVQKVNCEALLYRTFIVIPSQYNYDTIGFPPGVLIQSANATSNTTAYVCDTFANGALLVTQVANSTVTGNAINASAFVVGDIYTCPRTGVNASLTVSSVVTPARLIDIESIWYSISGAGTIVGLEWSGTNSSGNVFATTAKLLTEGNGYYGRNELQMEIVASAAANTDGSIYISSYNMTSGGAYDITLEIRKSVGFAQPQIY